jgi:hypothetical protein
MLYEVIGAQALGSAAGLALGVATAAGIRDTGHRMATAPDRAER